MYFVGVPLLIVPFAIYNICAFIIPGVTWGAPFASITLRSGAEWQIAPGDLLVAFSVLILLVELVKLTRLGVRSWVDHTLSLLLFAGMTAEFVMVQAVASPTFFLLLVIGFVDFAGGVASALGARAARRRAMQVEYPPYPAPVEAPTPAPKAEPNIEPKPDAVAEVKTDPKPPVTPSEPGPT